jgi:hypothetical protein
VIPGDDHAARIDRRTLVEHEGEAVVLQAIVLREARATDLADGLRQDRRVETVSAPLTP